MQTTPNPNATKRRRIVDADAHIDPPVTFWREYLPASVRDLAPRLESGEDCDYIVFEGNRRPMMMINNQAGRDGKNFKMKGRLSEQRDTWSPSARLADMDLDGIDAAVLFGGGPLGTTNSELYIESFRAYNRWLADYCSNNVNRLAGVAYLPLRDIDETIGLLREAVKLGHRTVNLPAFPQSSDGFSTTANTGKLAAGQVSALTGDPNSKRSYAHAEFDRLWAEICEHDLTVTFHLGGRVARFGDKEHFLPDLVMTKVAMAEPIAIAIYGGVFQRFPKMRWSIIESGVGWLSWMAEYMDRTWEKQRFWVGSTLDQTPSFYMDQNIYASFLQDRCGILNRNLPGGRNIMWSSDYPHSETTFPISHDIIARDFAGVSEEDIDAIICTRAARLFALPLPRL